MTDQERNFLLSLFSFDNKLSDTNKIKKLYALSSNIEKYYKTLDIPKRNGKFRRVYSPSYYLKYIQKSILKDILYDKYTLDCVTAYCPNKSIIDNAKPHINRKIILKLDIKDFFDNLSFTDVYKVYESFGFSKRICGLLTHLTTYGEFIPQGSPTAAYLSNIIMRDFDDSIYKWCKLNNIVYSRYSDDMIFSMDKFNDKIIKVVRKNLYKLGLELNNEKIHIVRSSRQQKITGIVVNNKIQVDIKYRKEIRKELYYIKKYGIISHCKAIGEADIMRYVRSLYGRINFVISVDKKNKEFLEYKEIIKEYF